MRNPVVIIAILIFNFSAIAQEKESSNTRLVAGLSGPELLHAGVTYRIANVSQVGLNAGIGPSAGTVWTAFSLEHRLYFGKNSERSKQKT
ncbi:MAG TPA: hypothetical protein VEB63_06985 [Chitinophagaceae bacterium]|nr:hypothetical protein [Chitinophagaceae bacterium]